AASLALEKKAIVELAATETCRNLVRNFFLRDRARKVGMTKNYKTITFVGVVGAGTMGTHIAYWLGTRGIKTIVHDHAEGLSQCAKKIDKMFCQSVEKGIFSTQKAEELSKLIGCSLDLDHFKDCDAVIEAAYEKIEVKKEIFKKLDTVV